MPRKPKTLGEFEGVFNPLISARMEQLGYDKLDQFAEYSGIPYSTLYNLVMGRVSPAGNLVKPSLDTLTLLARALHEPLYRLVYMLAPDAPGAQDVEVQPHDVRRFRVQVAGWVGAGPQQLEEINGKFVAVEEDFAAGKALRAFQVRGDSMSAGKRPIYDGDIVLVDTDDVGYNTAAVVARLVDGRYVCKMLKDDRFGRFLLSANPRHTNGTPTTLAMNEVDAIVGRVVRVIGNESAIVED
jgi:repressor LexA